MTREDFELFLVVHGFSRSTVDENYWKHPKAAVGIETHCVDIQQGSTYMGAHKFSNALAELRRIIAGNLEEGSEQWKSQKNSTAHIPAPK